MHCYRIARKKYADSLSGEGAKRYGGRWNTIGTPLIYTASSSSLAILEILVHIPVDLLPEDYYLMTISLPENKLGPPIALTDLPPDWKHNPSIKTTRQLGDQFYREAAHLALPIPSAVNELDQNILINPDHPDFDKVTLLDSTPLYLDRRLFKS